MKLKRRPGLTKRKSFHLSKISSIEDIYHISLIFDEKNLLEFINYCKKNKKAIGKDGNKVLLGLLKKSKTVNEFVENLNEKLVLDLREKHDELQSIISEKRKHGVDTLMCDLKAMSIPLKIKIFETTQNKKDFYRVRKIMAEIKKELHIR